MILAIDIGNTNIVLGGIRAGEIVFVARMATEHTRTEDEYGVTMKRILELYGATPSEISGAIISSVVPPVTGAIRGAVRTVTGCEAKLVKTGIRTGLNLKVENPSALGADMIVNAVAALAEYRPPLIIFDLGTATTISVVDGERDYLGSVICPGVRVSLDALSEHAAQLPDIGLEQPEQLIGRSTVESMRSGLLYGHAAMVDGMIRYIEEELGRPATVLATGGLSRMVVPLCRREVHCDENLLLKGLWLLWEKNRK